MVGCDPNSKDVLSCLRELPTGDIMGNLLGGATPGAPVADNVKAIRAHHELLFGGGGGGGVEGDQTWGYKPALFPLMSWGCTIDGVSLPAMPLDVIASGKYNKVPVIGGTNNDEGSMFVPMMGLVIPGIHFPIQGQIHTENTRRAWHLVSRAAKAHRRFLARSSFSFSCFLCIVCFSFRPSPCSCPLLQEQCHDRRRCATSIPRGELQFR
jgi:hypothetical protein